MLPTSCDSDISIFKFVSWLVVTILSRAGHARIHASGENHLCGVGRKSFAVSGLVKWRIPGHLCRGMSKLSWHRSPLWWQLSVGTLHLCNSISLGVLPQQLIWESDHWCHVDTLVWCEDTQRDRPLALIARTDGDPIRYTPLMWRLQHRAERLIALMANRPTS